LVADDIIIVSREIELAGKRKTRVAVAFVNGEECMAKHIGGQFLPSTGTLTSVVAAHENGAVLELMDGRLLSVPEYDRYDTGWWLPPYKALVASDEMYLWNLKKGKRVWVNPEK
jgi:hypothetical protein